MDANQFRTAAHAAIDQVIDYYETLPSRRVLSNVQPGYLRDLLPAGPPENGEPWDQIQQDIENKIMPGLTHWQSPNFFAFFPANSSYPGILGELYSAAFTSANFNWLCSPAATELETIVLDWLCRLISLPECYLSTSSTGGGGVLQGSASEAVVTVIVAARDRYLRKLTEGITDEAERQKVIDAKGPKLVALFPDQAHACTHKGALIAGTRHSSIKIPRGSNGNYILTGPILRKKLEEVTAAGLEPFYLTLTLGTTSTCAVDDFLSIAEVKKDYPNLWIHIDAAYAGGSLVCPENQHYIPSAALELFDSFDVNMHKWLLVNFDCSCLFVKERKHLLNALSVTPAYLRNEFSDRGLVTDYRDWQIPLGRRFRALKVWFVMRTYGVEGLRAHIRNCISVGEGFTEKIRSRSDLFEVFTPPAFGLTVFTIKPSHSEDANELTKEVYETINSSGDIFITSTVVDGTYAIRIVSGNPRIQAEDLKRAFGIIVRVTEEMRGRRNGLAAGKLDVTDEDMRGV